MNCDQCQLQIFDTDAELTRDALVHLTTCDDCRALDREVRLNASALAELREDVLPSRPPKLQRRWGSWAIAAAAAILALVLFLPREQPKPTNRAATTGSGPAPIIDPAPPAPQPVIATVRAPRPVTKPKPQPEPVLRAATTGSGPEPLMIKMLTDDPDVVIYWLADPIQGE